MPWIQDVKQGRTNLVLPDLLHSGGLWSTTQDFYHAEFEQCRSGMQHRLPKETDMHRHLIPTAHLAGPSVMPGPQKDQLETTWQTWSDSGPYRNLFNSFDGSRSNDKSRTEQAVKRGVQPLSIEALMKTESLSELSMIFGKAEDSNVLAEQDQQRDAGDKEGDSLLTKPFAHPVKSDVNASSPMECDWSSPVAGGKQASLVPEPYLKAQLLPNLPYIQQHMQKREPCLPSTASQESGSFVANTKGASLDHHARMGQLSVNPFTVSAAPGRIMQLVTEPSESEIKDLTSGETDSQDITTPTGAPPSYMAVDRTLSHKKLRAKLTVIMDTLAKQNKPAFVLDDKLKQLKPYVISGWTSDNYLKALMQKTNMVGEMFDNALDNVGEIRKDVAEKCQKKNPVVFTRELVYRLFTLGELEDTGIKFLRLSRRKMSAVRRCVMRYFPNLTQRVWTHSCLWKLKCHMTFILSKQVKRVQRFWLNEAQKSITVELDRPNKPIP